MHECFTTLKSLQNTTNILQCVIRLRIRIDKKNTLLNFTGMVAVSWSVTSTSKHLC